MSYSPSADVYWGYDLADLTDHETWDSLAPEWMEAEHAEWEEVLAKKLGWVEIPYLESIAPTQPKYTSNRQDYKENQRRYDEALSVFYGTREYKVWSENRSELHRLTDAYPVELRTYGGRDEPMYCVAVKASVQTAPDWGSVALKPLAVEPACQSQLDEFMKLMDLPTTGTSPDWHLNCSYG